MTQNKSCEFSHFPDFGPDFPYTCSYVEFDRCIGGQIPCHWHKEAGLFYIQKETLEYHTPGGKMSFPAGSGVWSIPTSCTPQNLWTQKKIKSIMQYVQEHYFEKLTVSQIAHAFAKPWDVHQKNTDANGRIVI